MLKRNIIVVSHSIIQQKEIRVLKQNYSQMFSRKGLLRSGSLKVEDSNLSRVWSFRVSSTNAWRSILVFYDWSFHTNSRIRRLPLAQGLEFIPQNRPQTNANIIFKSNRKKPWLFLRSSQRLTILSIKKGPRSVKRYLLLVDGLRMSDRTD